MALNAPIQGSAADIIKKAMIRLDEELERATTRGVMLLQVHDELVIETPSAGVDGTVDLVREVMEGIVSLEVPLVVDIGTGPSLAEAKA
jgi:DNA polymerase-1